MSREAARQSADGDEGVGLGGPSLISIAFVAALVFAPIVIATGLLTTPSLTSETETAISLSMMRRSLDPTSLALRHSAD